MKHQSIDVIQFSNKLYPKPKTIMILINLKLDLKTNIVQEQYSGIDVYVYDVCIPVSNVYKK